MTSQWFILMAKPLIHQIRFQSASSCAKTGPRKENRFIWDRNFKFKTTLLVKTLIIEKKGRPVAEAIT